MKIKAPKENPKQLVNNDRSGLSRKIIESEYLIQIAETSTVIVLNRNDIVMLKMSIFFN